MKVAYLILIAITAFAGCTKKGADSTKPVVTNMTKDTTTSAALDTLHYLALGDSYTIGQSVPSYDSFPYLLAAEMGLQKYPVASPPKIIATTGWTTDDLINGITQSGIAGQKFDFVTLLIGVNDQYEQQSQDNYRIKFQQVLNTAIAFAGGNKKRVFVLSIPDWGVTPFGDGRDKVIGPEIDQFNAINKQISTATGVNYLDITGISREVVNNPSLVAVDGLHPSAAMYNLWIQQLEPMIIGQLKGH